MSEAKETVIIEDESEDDNTEEQEIINVRE